ncbi:DUF3192 domain-containing protein [Ferrimonas aestuarii]|uniref:DUF3192 domain-containing protein n=1 Tax=Ferrimonas aestuarii TaxID=2569539 RepID=A0A4U1BQR5_9GAMM|nr:DUF3192 domain-containing protein [Ferrimonas aestuarii]TKB56672.1 DUF3192 domain-containing protein [Ferrimonas aestuarii]
MSERRKPPTNIIKIIGLIIGSYLVFAALVLNFYEPEEPVISDVPYENMDWREREEYNQQTIGGLSLGTTKAEAIKLMGKPHFNDAQFVQGKQVQLLHWRTQRNEGDGKTTRDECTPLLFVDDVLFAIGEIASERFLDGPIDLELLNQIIQQADNSPDTTSVQ